ncbi:MAG: PIN domain-containing protein [Desulfobacterales bacterium]|nr:PIN domain-containing protein [Desulfobacterales bacterium]
MRGILVDSNVILDIFLDDPNWAEWSESKLEKLSSASNLFINPVVYSEVSTGFDKDRGPGVRLEPWWFSDA